MHQETDINGSSQRESCINGKSDTKPMRSTTSRQELRDVELGALWGRAGRTADGFVPPGRFSRL